VYHVATDFFLDSVYFLDITSWIGQMACKIHQGLVPLSSQNTIVVLFMQPCLHMLS